MEEEKKVIDDFISTFSHEIRTPLTSIKGFSQTLYDNFETLSDEQKKNFLLIIKEQSQRLINLSENILSITKLDYDNKIILKEINLEEIINKTLDIIKMTYKNRKFELSFGKNIPSAISDYDKLQQVLLNIIENACKYSKIETPIKITVSSDNDRDYIKIHDQGIGIEEKYISKIFEKFYRIGDATKNIAQGSGLGLYISKIICDKIGAKIDVKSSTKEDNHFSEFTISLPQFDVEKITKTAISRA